MWGSLFIRPLLVWLAGHSPLSMCPSSVGPGWDDGAAPTPGSSIWLLTSLLCILVAVPAHLAVA